MAPRKMKNSTRKLLQKYFALKDKAGDCYEKMREIQIALTSKKLIVPGEFYFFADSQALIVGGKPKRCITLQDNFAQDSASRAVVINHYDFKVWTHKPKTEPGLQCEPEA